MDSGQLMSLLVSVVTLGGAMLTDFAITSLPVWHVLQRSHMELLAAGLPHLTKLCLLHPNLAPHAWSRLGALDLHTLFLDSGVGVAFRPQHMGSLASSVTRPLRLVLPKRDVEAAKVGLETLLAVRHVGAGFISLLQSKPGTAWEGTEVLVSNMAEE